MALAVYYQLNPQVGAFVPTVMAPKLAYRRGKQRGGEESASKHQIRSGDGIWAGRRGVRRLNPRRETKIKGKNGDRERKMEQKVANRRKPLARKRRRRGRTQRRLLRQNERRIKHVRVDGRSQLLRTMCGRWRWTGRTELDGR